jgi:hypothetical protein
MRTSFAIVWRIETAVRYAARVIDTSPQSPPHPEAYASALRLRPTINIEPHAAEKVLPVVWIKASPLPRWWLAGRSDG